jgi:hypothetical protein
MRLLLVVVTAAFAAFTGWVVSRTGYVGFFDELLTGPAGWQVLVDVSLALVLVLSWIRGDARATGRRFWPYALLTVALGSLGPLVYLVLRRPATSQARLGVEGGHA